MLYYGVMMYKKLFKRKEKELMQFVQNFQISINEEQMFDILRMKRRWPYYHPTAPDKQPTAEIISMYGQKHSYISDGTGFLDFDKMKSFYDKGYTVLLADVLDLTEELRTLERELIDRTGIGNIRGNFYFGNGKKDVHPSFDLHSHGYNVISKQIYGTNYWTVGDERYEIHDQEIIFIPAGSNHEVYKSDGKRLSLTINLGYGE
jgi:mannose-6-phosphate isomerase-like protein (cupin superfamily)